MQCLGEHGAMPKDLKKIIRRSAHSKRALHKLEEVLFEDNRYRSLVGTTQAIDIVQGALWCVETDLGLESSYFI